METEVSMTKGEARVRRNFNNLERQDVASIKNDVAMLIDFCEDGIKTVKENNNLTDVQKGETIRLWSLAQTAYEEGAMWAVKAATSNL